MLHFSSNNSFIMTSTITRIVVIVFFLLFTSMLQVGADRVRGETNALSAVSRIAVSDASIGYAVASPTPILQSTKRLGTRERRRLQVDTNNFLADVSPFTAGVTGGIVFLLLVICFLYCCCGCSLCDILMLFCCYELCCGDCADA